MIKKIAVLLASVLFISSIAASQEKSLSFSDVVDKLNLTKKTALAVKTNWQEMMGQEVTWTGKVVNVVGGKAKADIYAANKDRSTYRGYNIVLETYDIQGASKLDIGKNIKFKGVLSDYKGRKGRPIVIYLNSVELK